MVERLICTQQVPGSDPGVSTLALACAFQQLDRVLNAEMIEGSKAPSTSTPETTGEVQSRGTGSLASSVVPSVVVSERE